MCITYPSTFCKTNQQNKYKCLHFAHQGIRHVMKQRVRLAIESLWERPLYQLWCIRILIIDIYQSCLKSWANRNNIFYEYGNICFKSVFHLIDILTSSHSQNKSVLILIFNFFKTKFFNFTFRRMCVYTYWCLTLNVWS